MPARWLLIATACFALVAAAGAAVWAPHGLARMFIPVDVVVAAASMCGAGIRVRKALVAARP